MARNTLKLDTRGFESMLKKLDGLGGDVKTAVEDALVKASQTIKEDTVVAMDHANLPAGGKYATDTTKESIITDHRVRWEGQVGWVPVGFDFSKPGAGGYLITGTPRMKPDYELNRMYKQKRYMKQIQNKMGDIVLDYVIDKMEGSK